MPVVYHCLAIINNASSWPAHFMTKALYTGDHRTLEVFDISLVQMFYHSNHVPERRLFKASFPSDHKMPALPWTPDTDS